jgi:dihydroxyacetone kinase
MERRRKILMKILKAVMIVAIAASALTLGACAQHKEAAATTTASTYSK